MADIDLVIKIPEKAYNALTHTEFDANLVVDEMRKSIANGIPLSKGHGRLIDADEFFKDFTELEPYEHISHEYDIDAAPVVHGKWIAGKEIAQEMLGDKTIHIFYENYKCSVCGLILYELLFNVDGTPFYKFCPNCGAKMDGRRQNDE